MDTDDRQIAGAAPEQAAPIPPRHLIHRTGKGGLGRDDSDERYRERYELSGRQRKEAIIDALPDGYSFEGTRVLDFGCGAGRVIRQFAPEALQGQFWGCDPYRPTVAWLEEHLSPPFRFYVNDTMPMPHPDGYFDLIYAISVFTHITHDWSAWLLELHRILKPDGLLLATFIGPEFWGYLMEEPPAESDVGMCVLNLDQSLDRTSGPHVLHSPWWLRSHWGRAFELLTLQPSGFVAAGKGHGFVLGRKLDVVLDRSALEWPTDQRDLDAQRFQLMVLEKEAAVMGDKIRRLRRQRLRKSRVARIKARLRGAPRG